MNLNLWLIQRIFGLHSDYCFCWLRAGPTKGNGQIDSSENYSKERWFNGYLEESNLIPQHRSLTYYPLDQPLPTSLIFDGPELDSNHGYLN